MEILLVLLVAALLGFIALGVEDDRHDEDVKKAPARRIDTPVVVTLWDESLPTRPRYNLDSAA